MNAYLTIDQILGHGKDRASARVQQLAQALAVINWSELLRMCLYLIRPTITMEDDILELVRFLLLKADADDWCFRPGVDTLAPVDTRVHNVEPYYDEVVHMYHILLLFPSFYAFVCAKLIWASGNERAYYDHGLELIDYDPCNTFLRSDIAYYQNTTRRAYAMTFGPETPTSSSSSSSPPQKHVRRSRRFQPTPIISVVVRQRDATELNIIKEQTIAISPNASLKDLRIRIQQVFELPSTNFSLKNNYFDLPTKNNSLTLTAAGVNHNNILFFHDDID